MSDVIELLVEDNAAMIELEVREEIKVDTASADVEEMTEESAIEESVVGGVEIEQEPEVVGRDATLKEEDLTAPIENSPVEDCSQTVAPTVEEVSESTEEFAEIQVDQPLPELEAIPELAPESPELAEPLIPAAEEANYEIVVPKDEFKEPKSLKASRKTKKVGTKKSKKSGL